MTTLVPQGQARTKPTHLLLAYWGVQKAEISWDEADFWRVCNNNWRVSGEDQSFVSPRTLTEGFSFFNQNKTPHPVLRLIFSKSWSASKYLSPWYNKEGEGFLALLLTRWKRRVSWREMRVKNPGAASLTALVLITDEEDGPSRWRVPKLADFFVSCQKVTT